jgi:hypothetical protein
MDLGDPDFEPKGYVTKCNDKFIYITGSCKEFVNQFYDDPLKIQKVNEISPDLNQGTYVWIYLETKPKNVFLKLFGIPDRKIIVKKVISKSEVATEHLPTVYIYHRQNGNNVNDILPALKCVGFLPFFVSHGLDRKPSTLSGWFLYISQYRH